MEKLGTMNAMTSISEATRRRLLEIQRTEITEHHLYRRLAQRIRAPNNRETLEKIAADELAHYQTWRKYTGQDVAPDWGRVRRYELISRLMGFTFAVKLMERNEVDAQDCYAQLKGEIPEKDLDEIIRQEYEHEDALLALLDEERLRYTGSIVLGLNDALVELTGTLAGLTLALQNTRLIALVGLITGIAAALSMAASEYLSTKAQETRKQPVRAAIYTGFAYIATVLVLILPYLLLESYFHALGLTLAAAVTIIALFNYYISVAKDEPFRHRFVEMAALSLGIAALSFLIGYLARTFLGVDL